MSMKESKQKVYVSPEVEVIETQVQTVICVSNPNSTDSYGRESW